MREAASNLGSKAIAVLVLVIAGWILLKVIIGIASAVFFTVLVIAAVIAVLWSLNKLL
jgi:hypothetical protein